MICVVKYSVALILFFLHNHEIHGLAPACPTERKVHPTNQKEIRLVIYATTLQYLDQTCNLLNTALDNVPLFVDGAKPLLFVELKFGLWVDNINGQQKCGYRRDSSCTEDQKHTCALSKITTFMDRINYYRFFAAKHTADECARQFNIQLDDKCMQEAANTLLQHYEEAQKTTTWEIVVSPHEVFNGVFDGCTAGYVEEDFRKYVCMMFAVLPNTCQGPEPKFT